jgi:VWFA-related protein
MTRTRSARAVVAAVVGTSVVAWSLVSAQEAREGRFGEVVDVRLVNVEVWVTDSGGHRVSGLTADDFEILEDGKPVAITHFAEVEGNQPVLPQLTVGEVPTEMSAPEAPLIEPTQMVIYFDHLHLSPSSRPKLIQDVRRFLRAERVDSQRVLILSQTHELKTELAFGSSGPEIEAALDRLEKAGTGGSVTATLKRNELASLQDLWEMSVNLAGSQSPIGGGGQDAVCAYFMPRAVPTVQSYMRQARQRITVTLDHLAAVSSFLTGVPGVKTLLYLSDALEREPGADLARFINNLCPNWHDSRLLSLGEELTMDFTRLTSHANANRVTIFSLQTIGLQTSVTSGAQTRSMSFEGASGLDFTMRATERAGMEVLADETGGRTIFNTNRFDVALDAIASEMGNYYSLAYAPDHGGDLEEHRIEVRIKPQGRAMNVRHRRGYQDKNPDTRMAERLQGAVYLGLVENPLGVRLGAGTVRTLSAEDKTVALPLHVIVPIDNVVFLPGDEGMIAHLTLQITTQLSTGSGGLHEQKVYRIAQPPPDQELLSMVLELQLPEGVHIVAVAVRDDATRESSFVSTTVELHATAELAQGG